MIQRICTADGCDRPQRARDLCKMHYQRVSRHGGLESLRPRRSGCSVDGCESRHKANGYCAIHNARARRNGDRDLTTVMASGNAPGEMSPFWKGDEVGYIGLHARIRDARGSASSHQCVGCDQPAAEWSYENTGIKEKVERGLHYSVDIMQYAPRCVACHRQFDMASA